MPTLSTDDFSALRQALLDSFDTEARLSTLARDARGVSLDRLALGDDLEEIAEKLIERAQSESWLPALIEAAWQARQDHPVLTRFREEWRTIAVSWPMDPYRVLLLPGKTVLIDRVTLREALTTLEEANGSRVLIVDGDAESGKTYSVHYISYVSAARQTFRCTYVDLERVPRNAHNKIDAFTLGDAIAGALLGKSFAAPPDLNLTTWIDRYCTWLEEQLPAQSIRWVVIDHFAKVTVEESSFDLVAALAMRTYRNLASLRLVLLSYRDREWLQARVVGMVEYERIAAIGRRDLLRFFGQLHLDESKRRGEALEGNALAQRVTASVKRVLENIPESGVRRLETLGRVTWAEAQRILRPPPGPTDPVEELLDEVARLDQSGGDNPRGQGQD